MSGKQKIMNHTVGYRLFKICIVNYLRPKYLLGYVSIKGPDYILVLAGAFEITSLQLYTWMGKVGMLTWLFIITTFFWLFPDNLASQRFVLKSVCAFPDLCDPDRRNNMD